MQQVKSISWYDFKSRTTAQARGYKTFFILNSTENEISTAHKTKLMKIIDFSCFKLSDVVFIKQINVKIKCQQLFAF